MAASVFVLIAEAVVFVVVLLSVLVIVLIYQARYFGAIPSLPLLAIELKVLSETRQ